MIKIDDEGIIISLHRTGETGAVISILSANNGIVKGFVSNICSKKNNNLYHISNLVKFLWQSRLEDNLGYLSLSLVNGFGARYITDKVAMSILLSASTLLYSSFKERENINTLYNTSLELFLRPNAVNYVFWELLLLEKAGFGLDLSKCAVSKKSENLKYVSPKTGRAVSQEVAMPYLDILLPLPSFLIDDEAEISKDDMRNALNLSGYFLKKHIFSYTKFPEIRSILQDYLLK